MFVSEPEAVSFENDDFSVVDEPIDGFDPNFPDQNEDNGNDNDPNLVQDTDDRLDPNDTGFDRDPVEDLEPVVPGGLCGFGVGFASLASMISLGGMKRRR